MMVLTSFILRVDLSQVFDLVAPTKKLCSELKNILNKGNFKISMVQKIKLSFVVSFTSLVGTIDIL